MSLEEKINEIACRMYERMIKLDHNFSVECGRAIYDEALNKMIDKHLHDKPVGSTRYINPYNFSINTMFGVAHIRFNKNLGDNQVMVEGTTLEDIEVEDILLGRDW